ncbi:MAG: hypothetical protein JRE43_00570 [Deltaproteobacteria bacterium]|nr:hypothetical protein [Deltaproteobacteria bacterium]
MEGDGYIGGAIAGLVYFVAGYRMLRLSFKTKESPERLLGAMFLFWSIAYLFWYLGLALDETPLATPLMFVENTTDQAGQIALVLFLRLVFRRDERWAGWLTAVMVGAIVLGVVSSAWVGDLEGIRPLSNPWYPLLNVHLVVTFWLMIEGIRHYRMARQRMRLDLCKPLDCNRYLLWGLTGAVWLAVDFGALVGEILYEETGVWSPTLDTMIGAGELVAIALIWFVFFPPGAYQRWIERSGSAPPIGER